MRSILTILLTIGSIAATAQEPFQKDGKWGVSEHGDANDSIIVRADYDEIEMFVLDDGYFIIGLKDKEWYPLTSNKLLNQQRYEEIIMPIFSTDIVVAKRDGYIDIIRTKEMDFLLRNVQATEIVDGDLYELPADYLMTKNGKSFGLIAIDSKKEILKAKYTSVLPDAEYPENGWLFASEEGKTTVFSKEGTVLYTLSSSEQVVSMTQEDQSENLYRIMSIDRQYGMYNAADKWLVDPLFIDVTSFSGSDEVVIVTAKKGDGLFFNGKQLLEPIYITIEKSSQRGYLAEAVGKKGEFLLSPEGTLTPKKNE